MSDISSHSDSDSSELDDIQPVVPVALATGLACSFGFMLPVSTGPNALAYSTGHVPLPRMMKSGIFLDLAGAVAIWLVVRVVYY